MKLSTRLKRDISPDLMEGKTFRAIVDCSAAHTADTLDGADICHKALLSVGCKPLWQESPVINEREIIVHYTTTNYRDWCKA